MANSISNNPLIIDTASASIIVDKRMILLNVRWVGGTTAGHQAVITDRDDTIKWVSVANAANFIDESYLGGYESIYLDGLKVPTLQSGILYLTIS